MVASSPSTTTGQIARAERQPPSPPSHCGCLPRHVVVIGIDGLGSYYLEQDLDIAPTLKRLSEEGASTFDAHSFVPVLSLPNWGSLLLGTAPNQTGFITNDAPSSFNTHCFPSIFDLTKQQGIKTSLFAEWRNLEQILDQGGIDKMQMAGAGRDSTSITNDFNSYLRELSAVSEKSFSFVHLDLVDHAGHSEGYGSEAYFEAISKADDLVSSMVASCEHLDPLVIVVSDHGGIGDNHGQNNECPTPEEYRIPIIMHGSRVNTMEHEFGNLANVAATALDVFSIPAPTSWTGRSQLASVMMIDQSHHHDR